MANLLSIILSISKGFTIGICYFHLSVFSCTTSKFSAMSPLCGYKFGTFKIGELSMSTGSSSSYALAENFLKILQGLIFLSFNLLYSPLGNLSFLICANTRSPNWNYTSLLLISTNYLYLLLLSCSYPFTCSCNDCISMVKSSAFALLFSTFSKSLSP